MKKYQLIWKGVICNFIGCFLIKFIIIIIIVVVAMVTYCATQLMATRSPMIGQFVDTMILASTDKEGCNDPSNSKSWNYWKLFPATLNTNRLR